MNVSDAEKHAIELGYIGEACSAFGVLITHVLVVSLQIKYAELISLVIIIPGSA